LRFFDFFVSNLWNFHLGRDGLDLDRFILPEALNWESKVQSLSEVVEIKRVDLR
jgi:hypothetical protein